MTDPFEAALSTLYRAPLAEFTSERKRLAAELKSQGHGELSARVAKLGRPSVSAWAINQLFWQARQDFEAYLASAARVRAGDLGETTRHREALAKLRERAARLLREAGNAASETTLRRLTTTLSALGASGGFAPDPDGALVSDRDPPGFEALEGWVAGAGAADAAGGDAAARRAQDAEKRRAEDEERQRRLAERERLSQALRQARELQAKQQSELARLRAELQSAEQDLRQTQALLAELEERLTRVA